jgi:UDP-glucose 4-epimerase
MRVLVTGASGFLGSALIRELCRSGFHVRAMVHSQSSLASFVPEVKTVAADIDDPATVKEAVIDSEAVVHLAAKVHAMDDSVADKDYEAVNVEGTKHILDAAVGSGVTRFVFASSVKVFGEETQGCIDETQAPNPQTAYGRSKWQAEQLVSEYAGQHGLTTVSLRLPMVYGPTKKGNLYRMIEAIDHGRFPALPRLPAIRSLLHVENFVQTVKLCLGASYFKRRTYIVADAEPYSVTDLYNWLHAGLGNPVPRWRVPLWALKGAARCGDLLQVVYGQRTPLTTERLTKLVGSACFSTTAITRDLGYQAVHSFRETVPELIAFYRKTKSA